jgi:hypothetical protein
MAQKAGKIAPILQELNDLRFATQKRMLHQIRPVGTLDFSRREETGHSFLCSIPVSFNRIIPVKTTVYTIPNLCYTDSVLIVAWLMALA